MSHRLRIAHRTSYRYESPVRESKNEIRKTPAYTPRQTVRAAKLTVDPSPTHRASYRDYFGTIVERFEVAGAHDHLTVEHFSEVDLDAQADLREPGQAATLRKDAATEYLFRSPMVQPGDAVRELAAELRRDEIIDTIEAVVCWMRNEMRYDQQTTIVGTSIEEVLSHRSGVCQDYAHLACALLRECGIPARYVSGYFAPSELAVGDRVEAESHAWIEAFLEGWGWWAADITNDLPISERHVKVGHGRDYSDVIPFHGIHVGAAESGLEVKVSIERLPAEG
jgi:transglutaminase-like putative cysteine protease